VKRAVHGGGLGLVLLGACTFGSAGGHGAGESLGESTTGGSGDQAPAIDDGGSDGAGTIDAGEAGGSSGSGESTGTGGGEEGLDTSGTGTDPSSTGSEPTGPPPALCDRVLLVTGNTNVTENGDTPLYDRLVVLGYAVTVVQSNLSQAGDVGDNCLIVLSALGSSSDIGAKFRDVPVGVVILEAALYDDTDYVAAGGDLGWSDGLDDIEIADPEHSLATSFDGIVSIYSGGGRVSWGVPLPSAEVVAIMPDDPSRASLFGYEAGAAMANGLVAPARRVGFPGGSTSMPMTPERVDLFEAAALWAAGDLP
jgi:hypothetical protein